MVKKEILDAKDSINLMTEIAVLDNVCIKILYIFFLA